MIATGKPERESKGFLVRAAPVVLLLAMCPVRGLAQDPRLDGPEVTKPDPQNGQVLAEKLCVSCHVVEADVGPVQSDIPSFKSIANRPGQTREALMNWLTLPHPPMPDLGLSRQEIRDLGAYLISLRVETNN